MPLSTLLRGAIVAATVFALTQTPRIANATIVEFQTVMGNFQINLYDNGTPQTVANFLDYVTSGAYADSIVHRSAPGFVIQGGGFFYDPGVPISTITANAPVANEPVYANVRGTIAMAKLGGDPDSATNQWFINLADNTQNLDGQNGGFTVFGEVVGDGMNVVDAIAALPRFAFESPFNQIPLTNYSATDFNNAVPVDDSHLIIISAVVVTDPTVDSAGAAGLDPLPTTYDPSAPAPGTPAPGSSGGGGALGAAGLLVLLVAGLRRRRTSRGR